MPRPIPGWLGAVCIILPASDEPDRALDVTSLDLKVIYAKSHFTPVQTAWHTGYESLFDRRQSFHDNECSQKTECGNTLPICRLSNSGRDVDSRCWMACTVGHMKCLCWEPDKKRHAKVKPMPWYINIAFCFCKWECAQASSGSSGDRQAFMWEWLAVGRLLTSCLCALGSTIKCGHKA